MVNDLIVLEQEPIIREQLELIKADIDIKVKKALATPCTEDSYKDVKKMCAEINKDFKELEGRRKEVKRMVLAPYERFDKIYGEYVRDSFLPALETLKERYSAIESTIKREKEAKVQEYFAELCESYGIYFLAFRESGIKITMSASVKSLKEQAKKFLDRIQQDLVLIGAQENSAEISAEYKNENSPCFLNAAMALKTVQERRRAIENEKQSREEDDALRRAEMKTEAVVAEVLASEEGVLAPPKKIDEPVTDETIYKVSFSVQGTKPQLKKLKEFLNQGGYIYE